MEKLVRLLVGLLFLLSILPRSSYGRFNVEKSSISVISPDYLKSKEDSAIANFGIPHYGGTLLGTVIYPEKDSTGCEPFKNESLDSSSAKRAFFLLDRGECFFSKKVWNAQNAGAAAVLIADNKDEPLITMDNPSERSVSVDFLDKINIPSALIKKSFGENLKKCLKKGDRLMVKLDWTESVPHPDRRVEYELWTNSNDECGLRCDEQMKFIKDFKGHAQILEKGGFTKFTPHYITWFCPQPFIHTLQCKSQCINQGRYCAPDPEGDFWSGYQGKDVLLENLRQLCVHRVANESNRPWTWWDFATDVHIRCSMKQNKYSKDCAEKVIESLGISLEKVKKCMGDPDADADNPVLQAEQTLQVGHGSRGDVTILPTLVINNVQYRGNLDRIGILEAICSGFKESTEPPICLTGDIETNECEEKNGGCWQDVKNNITSCKDTFRGRVCECPVAKGVQYHGDGYLSCEAIGPARCTVNHGGCWSETREGRTYSACTETQLKGCQCPSGFSGDGNTCQDVDECKEKLACQCQGCSCKNTWGGYDCKCNSNQLYIRDQDACIVRKASKVGMFLIILILCCVFGACIAGYLFYKYRLRSYMDSEIMAIMSQYMPIDNQRNEVQSLREDSA